MHVWTCTISFHVFGSIFSFTCRNLTLPLFKKDVFVRKGKITNSMKPPLMQMWSAFNMFLILYFWSLRKVNYDFISVKSSVKISRYVPYGYSVVLDSVSFWYAENSKCQTCLRKQQMCGTKCLQKIFKDNRKPFSIQSSTRLVTCTNFLFISYILQSYPSKWAILVTEIHCLI